MSLLLKLVYLQKFQEYFQSIFQISNLFFMSKLFKFERFEVLESKYLTRIQIEYNILMNKSYFKNITWYVKENTTECYRFIAYFYTTNPKLELFLGFLNIQQNDFTRFFVKWVTKQDRKCSVLGECVCA